MRSSSISTRTLSLSFFCMCFVLVLGFSVLNLAIKATIKEGLKRNLQHSQEQFDLIETEYNRRNAELIAILSNDASLKAAVGLLREESGPEVRRTIENQLKVMAEGLDYDLLMVLDTEGKVAATAGVSNDNSSLDVSSIISERVSGRPSLIRFGKTPYEVASVPINLGDENLGSFVVGKIFSLNSSVGFGYTVLTGRNEIVASTLPGDLKDSIEREFSGARSLLEDGNEVRAGQETYLVLKMDRAGLGTDYQLFCLAPVNEAMSGFTRGLRNAFIVIGVGAILVALVLSVLASRAISKPLADLASQLEKTGETGALWNEFGLDSSTREVNLLAGALNHAASARRQVEDALEEAKEEAEAGSRAKSEFLANVSHELRTPMNGILGMTDLVLDTDLTVDQRADLGLVKSSAQKLLVIINDILDFSHMEVGRLELDCVNFDLHRCLGETIEQLTPRAQAKGLALVCEVAPDVPRDAFGDPVRLGQTLVQLVDNAIKFTERGQITVRVEQDHANGFLHFSVQDTGIGIPSEKIKVIFEAFSQADGSSTRKYGGNGLGLTISSRLVEMMQGTIWVESEPDRGSCFHFTARLNAPTTTRTPAQETAAV
jgi:signal transduction histidine kinase